MNSLCPKKHTMIYSCLRIKQSYKFIFISTYKFQIYIYENILYLNHLNIICKSVNVVVTTFVECECCNTCKQHLDFASVYTLYHNKDHCLLNQAIQHHILHLLLHEDFHRKILRAQRNIAQISLAKLF